MPGDHQLCVSDGDTANANARVRIHLDFLHLSLCTKMFPSSKTRLVTGRLGGLDTGGLPGSHSPSNPDGAIYPETDLSEYLLLV